jgi:hypothetical protein
VRANTFATETVSMSAQSGHYATEFQCPLLGVKRTFGRLAVMSASDPYRTGHGQTIGALAKL